jgi:hypothetical protein
MIEERRKLSSLYRIEDGIIYYNYFGRVYSREVCEEVVTLLTKRRRVYVAGEYRFIVALYENEMASINAYICLHDVKFKMQPYYPKGKEIISGVGEIKITVNGKPIK